MANLRDLLFRDDYHVSIQVNSDDLKQFVEILIDEISKKEIKEKNEREDDKLITKKEVLKLFNISNTALWQWQKKKYLIPIKAGRKIFYKKTDIEAILNKH